MDTAGQETERPFEPWFVLSLARGLDVVRAFGQTERGLTVSETARACGLSRAAARRFILTLVELGYVAARDDRYFLRSAALDLGYAYLSSMQFDKIVQPEIDELSTQTGESSSFAILSGTKVLFLARAPAPRLITIRIGVGSRLPAYATSLGKVLLAYLTPAQREARLARIKFARYTEATITDVDRLRSELTSIRDRGFGTAFGELELDVASIAVPVFGGQGDVVAAINVSTYASRLREKHAASSFLAGLNRAAGRITDVLRMAPHLGLNLQRDAEDDP